MRIVFADTFYWVALANPRDPWHDRARAVSASLGPARLVTTDEVLVEFLTFLSGYGAGLRRAAVRLVHSIFNDPNIDVLPQTHATFLAGRTASPCTPCVSMAGSRC